MTPAAALLTLLAAGADPEITRLESGSSVPREMSSGETHRYEVDLRAGEYLQVLVEQQGVDVTQALLGPDGATLLETDSPCGPIGAEPLAFVADAPGLHRLVLTAGDIAVPPRGRYEIRVEALREPTGDDRLRVLAVRAAADALRQSSKDPGAELDHYSDALHAWEALGDRRMQLWTLLVMGYARAFALDDASAAEELYRRALATAVEIGDEWAEARVSDDLSQVMLRLGGVDETRALMERALALHRRAGRPAFVARMLTVLGSYFSLVGEPQVALDRLYDALEINQAIGDPQEVARTRIEIGATYLRLGDPGLALEQHEQALPDLGDPARRARCITEIGVARLKLGDHGGARRDYEQALGIYRTLEAPVAEADTLIGLADLERDLGNLEAARKAALSALATFTARAYPLGIAGARCRLGEIHRRLGESEEARADFAAVLDAGGGAGGTARVCAEQGLARLDARAGALDSAERHAEAAMGLLETLRSLASPRAREAALAQRAAVFEILTDVLMRRHLQAPAAGYDAAAFEVSERARARSLLDLLGEGRVDVSEGVRPELRAEERALRQRLNAAAALRSRSVGAGERDSELDRLSAQLADVESRIRTASPHYAALTQARPLTLAEVRARVLAPDTQLVQYALGEEQGYAWVVSRDRLESARLAPRAEIEAAALRLHGLLSSPPGRDAAGLDSAREELSRLVLAPLAPLLHAPRLLLVAPGALQYVPFGALPLNGTSLLSRFELVGAPSSSVIATLRDEAHAHRSAHRSAAVFADPVFERSDPRLARVASAPAPPAHGADHSSERVRQSLRGGLSRLPFSRSEADAITTLAGPREAVAATGFAANRSAATSPRLADYRIVHFATHAVLDTRRPELSGVVLSMFDESGRPQDGFLRLHDVYNLRLGADLVVLSGCQTGLGQDLKGEGLVGLTRGFMYAGAPRVVASLWRVDDASTAELMKRFYRAMLKEGRRPADALRTAQLEMSRRPQWAAPFHWAGFVLQGEWR